MPTVLSQKLLQLFCFLWQLYIEAHRVQIKTFGQMAYPVLVLQVRPLRCAQLNQCRPISYICYRDLLTSSLTRSRIAIELKHAFKNAYKVIELLQIILSLRRS